MDDVFAWVALGSIFKSFITVLALSSIRLTVISYMLPPMSEGVLHGPVRTGMIMLCCMFIAFGQPLALAQSLTAIPLVEIALRETLIGLAIGMAASSVFWVAESAGIYIDDLTGYNNAQVMNPSRSEQSTPMGALLAQIATVLFWALGGMTFLLGTLYESYHWWPLFSTFPVPSAVLESFVLQQTDSLMQAIAKLAAPMMLILVLIDLAFALASKSASKLDLMSLSQPVKGAITVIMIALFVGVFVDQIRTQVALYDLAKQLRAAFP